MDDEKDLAKVSTDEQRQSVMDLASAASEWLDDEGMNSETAVYKAKHTELKLVAEAIFKRFSEMTERPTAVSKAREQLAAVKLAAAKWSESMPQITDEEKSKLTDEVEKAMTWLDDKETAQKAKTKYNLNI